MLATSQATSFRNFDDRLRRSMMIHRDRFLEIVCRPPDSKEGANLTDRFHMVELARHSDVRMTMRYTHIGLNEQAKSLESLPYSTQYFENARQ